MEKQETENTTQKENVETLQILAETRTDRYWYQICEKKWAKGTFYSLERGDLMRIMGSSEKGQGYPTKMFTLPKDKAILDVLIKGIQKIPDTAHKGKR